MTDINQDIMDLMSGTTATTVTDSKTMHSRSKILTPLPHLNAYFGGGLPMSVIVEAYGEPASGKSSTMYVVLGNFQKQHPDGIAIIIDTEASVDASRMEYMGCDGNRVIRIPASTIEKGFTALFTILDNKNKNPDLKDKPCLILYDTISVGNSQKQFDEKRMNAGGMTEVPRIIKTQLNNLMPYIEESPMLVILLNQVTTQFTKFGAKLTSGGGWGLKHIAHVRLRFDGGGANSTEYDGIFPVRKNSSLTMEKSKLSPLLGGLSVVIDITKGGTIDGPLSMINYIRDSGLDYYKVAAWWQAKPEFTDRYPEFANTFDKYYQPGVNFRQNDLRDYISENEYYMKLLQVILMDDIMERYTYQGRVCGEYHDELLEEVTNYSKELGLYIEPKVEEVPEVPEDEFTDESDIEGEGTTDEVEV